MRIDLNADGGVLIEGTAEELSDFADGLEQAAAEGSASARILTADAVVDVTIRTTEL